MKQSEERMGLIFRANSLANPRNDWSRVYLEMYWKSSLKYPKLFSPARIVYQCKARDAVHEAEADTHFFEVCAVALSRR